METEPVEGSFTGNAAGEPVTDTEEQFTQKSEIQVLNSTLVDEVKILDEETHDDEGDEDMMTLVDLLNGLAADDPKAQERALALAEELIRNNDDDLDIDEAGDAGTDPIDDGKNQEEEEEEENFEFVDICKDTFAENLSQDELNERKKTRKERKVKSDIYRQNGNICSSKHDYEEAVRCYTEAIDLIRDSPSLYTNRALANIKLGHYVEAIEDCNKAIFLSDKSLKARLYKAKALYLNGNKLECVACLDESRKVLPAYVKQIHHCQMALFTEHGDAVPLKKENDVFPGESFMRLAATYNVAKMSAFFEDSPLKRANQKGN